MVDYFPGNKFSKPTSSFWSNQNFDDFDGFREARLH